MTNYRLGDRQLSVILERLEEKEGIDISNKSIVEQIEDIKKYLLEIVELEENILFSEWWKRGTQLAATARKISVILCYNLCTKDTILISNHVGCSEARVKEMIRPWEKWWQHQLNTAIKAFKEKINNKKES